MPLSPAKRNIAEFRYLASKYLRHNLRDPSFIFLRAATSSSSGLCAAKYVCGSPLLRKEGCLVYSFGSNGQTSFEEDIIRRAGCAVHIFDPTMNEESIQKVEAVTGDA